MKIKNCRICNSRKLKKLFSLGNMKFTGKFPKKNQFIPSGDVELIICNRCKLVQLRDNFNLKYLYNKVERKFARIRKNKKRLSRS